MIELTASEVAEATGGRLAADPGIRVTGPVIADSRMVEPGALFVALPGEKVDGADFAGGAVAAGAVLVLAARELDGLPVVVVDDVAIALGNLARAVLDRLRTVEPAVKVFSITGSAGKTTTKDLLGQVMAAEDGDTIAPTGSFNSEVGLPLTVLRGTERTRQFVLELGADKPGDIGYLASIARPQIAILLMAGTAHIEFFGSQDAIAEAKAEVLGGMVPGGTAVLNADDERIVGLAGRAIALGHRVVTFGRVRDADVRAENVTVDATGRASFTLRVSGRIAAAGEAADDVCEPVTLRLVGEHHVSNALATAAAAILAGVAPATVAARLSAAVPGSPHRMAVTERPDGVTVIDDAYNANPESMRAALRSLAVMAGRQRRSVAVLGEMRELGEGSRTAHDAIGRLVVRLNVKLLIVVGEGAYHIHEGAMQEGSWGEESVFVPDLDTARAVLDDLLRPGDVVLVKASNGAGLWRLGDELAAGAFGAPAFGAGTQGREE